MYNVVKRDGKLVSFDLAKISTARPANAIKVMVAICPSTTRVEVT